MTNNRYHSRWIEFLIISVGITVILSLFFGKLIGFVLSAILVGLSPLILYYGFIHPDFFCLIFYVFSLFRLHEVLPFLMRFNIPFIAAMLGMVSLILNVLLKKIPLYWQKEMSYFAVFFAFITLGVPLSYNFGLSYAFWSDIFLKIGIIFFLITWTIRDTSAFKSILLWTIASGVFLSVITIYNKSYGINLIEGSRASVGGINESVIGDPNDLALTLLFPLSFCFSLFFTKTKSFILKFLGLLSALIIISALVATQSRGGLLGLGGIITYFFTRKFKSKFLVIIIMIVTVVLLFSISNITSRQSGGYQQGIDESAMGRIHAWQAAINMAIHHPIWGVGLNGFHDNFFNYAVVWDRVNQAVHSSWFDVLASSGFVGLSLFLACVYQALKLAKHNIKHIDAVIAISPKSLSTESILATSIYGGLIGFCISSTFLTQGFSWPFYLFFALSISLSYGIKHYDI